MEHREVPFDLLVTAVLDGRPVDWDSAESSASSDYERNQIRHFRTLAAIADPPPRIRSRPKPGCPLHTAELWGSLELLRAHRPRIVWRRVSCVGHQARSRSRAETAPPPRFSADWPTTRALEEGRLLARIRHPNVVTVFGADRIDDRVGIWMEFVRGRTLAAGPRRATARSSARESTAIGLDLCLALVGGPPRGLFCIGTSRRKTSCARTVVAIVLMDFGAGRDDIDEHPARAGGHAAVPRARGVRGRAGDRAQRHLQRRRAAVSPGQWPPIRPRAGPRRNSARRTARGSDHGSATSGQTCPTNSCRRSSGRSNSIPNSATRAPARWKRLWRGWSRHRTRLRSRRRQRPPGYQ